MKISPSLAKELVETQFPRWDNLPVRPVENDGHDNRTFRLGEDMSVRLPSGELYALHVGIEHDWLPFLSSRLPFPIPEPLGRGKPGSGYPWPWSINRWIPGETASKNRIGDMEQFASDLAKFLNAMQDIDGSQGPPPGPENFYRGGNLALYDSETRQCIETVGSQIDLDAAIGIWESALDAQWNEVPVWIHGDVAVGNLLVRDGRLCAVIDFGQLAVGDPSCDLTIAWTFFTGASRTRFFQKMRVLDSAWTRARGWALWKALLTLADEAVPESQRDDSRRVIEDLVAEQNRGCPTIR